MKILQVNKFFFLKGGAETYFFNLLDLLKKHGHKVFAFSQKNVKNFPSAEKGYFVSNLDLSKINFSLVKILRIFWSGEAKKKMARIIKEKKPDLIHFHNIYHQLSPSVLIPAKKAGVPTVMTVHDFKLIRPEYTLRADGKKTKGSFVRFLLNLEFSFHHFLDVYQKNVDVFLAPSEFVKNQLVKNGFKEKQIQVLPLFLDLKKYDSISPVKGKYIVFFGRLDESKGVDVLIKAFNSLKTKTKLKIVGAGPEENNLKKIANGNVEFTGFKSGNDLIRIIKGSLFAVFPSRVHETFGLSILESFACFKPVIATDVGAFPELINEENGILIGVNKETQLAQAISKLLSNPNKVKIMGASARKTAEKFSPEKHYQKLEAIYKKLIQ